MEGRYGTMPFKDAPDLPDGLTAVHVKRWIGGVIGSAPLKHVDYVTDRWTGLPDNAGRVSPDGAPRPKRGTQFVDGAKRIEVTAEMSKLLRAELARKGIDHATMLNGVGNVPEGLNARIIAGWLYRQAESSNVAYWNFVISSLAKEKDFAGTLPPLKRTCHGRTD